MRKKKILIISAIIILVLVATFGASVAIFSKAINGDKLTTVRVGDLTFKYTEVSGIGNGINLVDPEPISDSEGKALDQYFDFKINANLVGSDMIYEVSIEPTEDSTINLDGIKVYITRLDNNVEYDINSNYDGLGKVKTISDYTNGIIYQERILKNTKNYEKNFRVRIWIDEDVDIYTDDYMGKAGAFRVNVNARSNQSMMDTTVPVPVITGGTGTTWTTSSQTVRLANQPELGGTTYEYYVTNDSTDIPNDLTIATGTTSGDLLVEDTGTSYVYYRTVAIGGSKSAWSAPQVINLKMPVTLNANGGTLESNVIYAIPGNGIGTLPTPVKDNKYFEGWYLESNFTTKVDENYVPTVNTTLYARYGTEVDLNLASRTSGTPSNTSSSNDTKRTWNTNTYVNAISSDNYYAPGFFTSSSISTSSITVASGCGYGVVIPLELQANKSYIITPSSSGLMYYAADGTYLGVITGQVVDNNKYFVVPSNATWVLFNYSGGGNCTASGATTSRTFTNIHLYQLD